jgi:flagellar protein FlbT
VLPEDSFRADGYGVYQPLTIVGKDRDKTVRNARADAAVRHILHRRTALPSVPARFISTTGGIVMALKVELKPHERIIIGACVVTNTDQRARLLIDGDKIPILREKDILTPETADTPAKLIYLAVQLMYLSPEPQINHGTYFSLLRDVITTMPGAWPIIEGINNDILNGDLYKALKEVKKLIAYEKKLLDLSDSDAGSADAREQRSA